MRIYTTANCSGTPVIGSAASFASPGITVTVPANQTTNLTATATDTAGNVSGCSNPFPYTQDSTAPSAPSVTGTAPASPSNDNQPEVQGTAQAGSLVRIYPTGNCSGTALASGSAATFANPGITVSVAADATTTLTATAADAGGTSGCSNSQAYLEDSTAPPPPSITDTDPDSPADDTNPEVKGSAEAGSTVSVHGSGDCTGTALATGSAALFAAPGLTVTVPDGAVTTLTANATDAAGNGSTCSASFAYTEVALPVTRGAGQRALRRTNEGPATSASSASARKQAVLKLERKREAVLTRLGPFMPGSEAEASELASPWHLSEAYEESCLATLITEEARRRLLATGLARDGDVDNRWARVLLSAYGRDLVALSAVRQRLGGRWLGARAKGEAERSARRRFTAVVVEIEAEQRSAGGMVGRGPVSVPSVAVPVERPATGPPSAPARSARAGRAELPEPRPSAIAGDRRRRACARRRAGADAILLTRPFAGSGPSPTLGAAVFTQQAIRGLNMDAVVAAAERAEARAAARERARERAAALAAARERARERAAREAALAEAAAEEPAPEESTTTAEAPVEPAAPVASAPAPAPAPAAPAPAAPAPEPEPAPSGGGDNCFTFEC